MSDPKRGRGRPRAKDGGLVRLDTRVPVATHAAVQAIVEREGRRESAVVRDLLDEALRARGEV